MEPIFLAIVVLLLIFGLAIGGFFLVDKSGIPSPFNWVLKGLILLIALYALYVKFVAGSGVAPL